MRYADRLQQRQRGRSSTRQFFREKGRSERTTLLLNRSGVVAELVHHTTTAAERKRPKTFQPSPSDVAGFVKVLVESKASPNAMLPEKDDPSRLSMTPLLMEALDENVQT